MMLVVWAVLSSRWWPVIRARNHGLWVSGILASLVERVVVLVHHPTMIFVGSLWWVAFVYNRNSLLLFAVQPIVGKRLLLSRICASVVGRRHRLANVIIKQTTRYIIFGLNEAILIFDYCGLFIIVAHRLSGCWHFIAIIRCSRFCVMLTSIESHSKIPLINGKFLICNILNY